MDSDLLCQICMDRLTDIVKCILLCYFVLFCKYNSFYISSGDIGTSIFLTININSLLFTTNRKPRNIILIYS